MYKEHIQTEEPKGRHVNRFERSAHTYFLVSQEWVQRNGEILSAGGHSHPKDPRKSSEGWKCSKTQQPLTS